MRLQSTNLFQDLHSFFLVAVEGGNGGENMFLIGSGFDCKSRFFSFKSSLICRGNFCHFFFLKSLILHFTALWCTFK